MNRETIIHQVIHAALDAVSPSVFMPRVLNLQNKTLTINGKAYILPTYEHIYLIAIGKAAVGMAEAAHQQLGAYVTEGIVLTKHLPEKTTLPARYRLREGGHPFPTKGSLAATREILSLLDRAGEPDLILFLISGGGSALLCDPFHNIPLEDYRKFCAEILRCGADITEFNILRKHLDQAKGGRLAQYAAPAQQLSIILSDVVGSPLDIIASGPTVPDASTYQNADAILKKFSSADFPPSIRETIQQGCAGILPESPKTGEDCFLRSDVFVAAENRTAAYAAAQTGTALGFHSAVLNTRLTGESSQVGALLPSFLSEAQRPGLLIFGGETTVHIHGEGLGGRNLETALAAVRPLSAYSDCALVTLATDGEDGPTDAAGAIITPETLSIASAKGLIQENFLRANDSYSFFAQTGGLLRPGPTGTNVNDLTFLFAF